MVSKLETKFQNFVATAGSLLVYQRLAAVRPAGRHAPHVTLSRRSLFCTNQTQVLFKTFFYAQKYDDW